MIRSAERFDSWLSIYGATQSAEDNEDGLFGASRAGSDSLLGKLEEIVIGRKEPEQPAADGYSAAA